MSGLEVLAVVAACAAVVSAFHDGDSIVRRIKEKRRLRRESLATASLEQSLAEGPSAVQKEEQNGIDRFGTAFAKGDRIARDALTDVVIQLQGSLLKHLSHAQEDDTVTDFTIVVDASNLGRIRTISALGELYQRMLTAAPITMELPPRDCSRLVRPENLTRLITSGDVLQEQPSPLKESRRSLIFRGFFGIPHRQTSVVSEVPVDTTPTAGRRPTLEQRTSSLIRLLESPTNSSDLESHPSLDDSSRGQAHTNSSQNSSSSSSSSHRFSEESELRTIDTFPSIVSLKPTFPSQENNYGGFCETAFGLQNQWKNALKLRDDHGQVHSQVKIWACPKCSFQGPAYKLENKWIYDPTVRHSAGVTYKWSFLAKSHVAMKDRSKHGVFTYRCIFCFLSGISTPDILGIFSFIEHAATHRGQSMTELVLHKTCCINDKVAADKDPFDINLHPLDCQERQNSTSRERSSFETARTSPSDGQSNQTVL